MITSKEVAISQDGKDTLDPAWLKANPVMCPDCFGCGQPEDFRPENRFLEARQLPRLDEALKEAGSPPPLPEAAQAKLEALEAQISAAPPMVEIRLLTWDLGGDPRLETSIDVPCLLHATDGTPILSGRPPQPIPAPDFVIYHDRVFQAGDADPTWDLGDDEFIEVKPERIYRYPAGRK